jgi:hypothetical protein
MATNNMVPYSNPQGNNQTTPSLPTLNAGGSGGVIPAPVPTNPPAATAANPFVPATAAPASPLSVPNAGSTSSNATQSDKQIKNIVGKGVGTDISDLLNSIGGVDSATLQEYAASLVPQEATAQANLNATLGAGGVSANSSVAAIGDANLQAQETAAIAGESAQLTQSGQNLEAQILEGLEPAAEKEVAESPWDVFSNVVGGVEQFATTTAENVAMLGG